MTGLYVCITNSRQQVAAGPRVKMSAKAIINKVVKKKTHNSELLFT